MSPIHQSDPEMRPDDEFIPGSWAHLVVGNEGRLLDARRTPVRIVELGDRTGQFTVEILAFEDAGARWVIDYEKHGNFQFAPAPAPGNALNDEARVGEIVAIAKKFDRSMTIAVDPAARKVTDERLVGEIQRIRGIRGWLGEHSIFLREGGGLPDPATREGDPRLHKDLKRYMESQGLWDMEELFAKTFVSAPMGEMIKGHRIVIAELGLVAYEGKVIRDETIFDPPWNKTRRADHVITRIAFIRAMMAELGIETVTLYRGMSTDRPDEPPGKDTFVSATFSRVVAESFFDAYGESSTGLMQRQAVPIERLFMTYLETEAMNRQFKEAEAVLLAEVSDRGGILF